MEQMGTDLTAQAKAGKLDPVIGRQREIERVIQILSRRRKNNPVLVGEPGVGKTAIVEGLAQRLVTGDVPHSLADKRLLLLDLGQLVAGHHVPRPVRGAAEAGHQRGQGHRLHPVHRRDPHPGRRRIGLGHP